MRIILCFTTSTARDMCRQLKRKYKNMDNHFKMLRVADVRKRMDAVAREEITYSKAVELLNQDANEALALAVVSGSSSGRESEGKFYLSNGGRARLALDDYTLSEQHPRVRIRVERWGDEDDIEDCCYGIMLMDYGQVVALRNQLNKHINQMIEQEVR